MYTFLSKNTAKFSSLYCGFNNFEIDGNAEKITFYAPISLSDKGIFYGAKGDGSPFVNH